MPSDRQLTPAEFENLFSLDDAAYEQQAPDWLRRVLPAEGSKDITALVRELKATLKTNQRLEQVLGASGVPIPQDIPYQEAKDKIEAITELLAETPTRDEYNNLTLELDKYVAALMSSDEYQEELARKESEWEQVNYEDNLAALKAVRRHLPVNVRLLSESALSEEYHLPKPLARKLIRTNVLQLLRKSPESIEKMHPSMLEGLKTTGLTLTERRALYLHLKTIGPKWTAKDPMTERKYQWYSSLKVKFQEILGQWNNHIQEFGRGADHSCRMIGNQCPFKSDAAMDYSGDYGFPEEEMYEESETAASVKLFPLPSSPPARPPAIMGGLLAEIGKAASKQEETERALPQPSLSKNNLLAEIQGKKKTAALTPPKNLLAELSQMTTGSSNDQSLDSPLMRPPMGGIGGLLAGIGTPKLKKTCVKLPEKKSLLREVTPETKSPIVAQLAPIKDNTPLPPQIPATKNLSIKSEDPNHAVERRSSIKIFSKAEHRLSILQHHYGGGRGGMQDAVEHCFRLETAMDKLDAATDKWIEQQMLDIDDLLGPSEIQEWVDDYRRVLLELEPVVVDLDDRAKKVDRCAPECSLGEDLHKLSSIVFNFILMRLKAFNKKDKSIRNLIKEMNERIKAAHEQNLITLKTLDVEHKSTRKVRNIAKLVELKKENMTPKLRKSMRDAEIEKHYGIGKSKEANDATRCCDSMETAMDVIDNWMSSWVDQMIEGGETTMGEEAKDKVLAKFCTALKDLEPVVKSVTKRAEQDRKRSQIECQISEDLRDTAVIVFNFITLRFTKLGKKDKVAKKLIVSLNESLKSVHEYNRTYFDNLKVNRVSTRKIRSTKEILKDKMDILAKEKEKKRKTAAAAAAAAAEESVIVPVAVEEEQGANIVNRRYDDDAVEVEEDDELIFSKTAGRDQLEWQLIHQVDDLIKYKHKLEKALSNAGLTIPDETISYEEAEANIAEISKKMQEVGFKHRDYFSLEQQMEKYQSALMSSDEYRRKLLQNETNWDMKNASENAKSLIKLRRHMPVDIRNITESVLVSTPTPNGKELPAAIVKKFKRTNALQLIRLEPKYIEQMHFANLEGMSLSNITLTENRAIYEHIKPIGARWQKGKADKSIERKYMWFMAVRNKLKQSTETWERHVADFGCSSGHACPLRSACPVQIEANNAYDGDYGFPSDAQYEKMEVAKEDMEKYTRAIAERET
jgi:hypothetical protein